MTDFNAIEFTRFIEYIKSLTSEYEHESKVINDVRFLVENKKYTFKTHMRCLPLDMVHACFQNENLTIATNKKTHAIAGTLPLPLPLPLPH